MAHPFFAAPIGKRLSAQFIDECLAFCVGYAALLGLRQVMPTDNGIPLLAFVLILMSYTLLADGMAGGQSWGKRFMGLYVVHNETEQPCGYGRSVLRNLSYLLGVIDLAFLVLRKDKRRLGDLIANTKIVVQLAPARMESGSQL